MLRRQAAPARSPDRPAKSRAEICGRGVDVIVRRDSDLSQGLKNAAGGSARQQIEDHLARQQQQQNGNQAFHLA